jgi:hypothetical protein
MHLRHVLEFVQSLRVTADPSRGNFSALGANPATSYVVMELV